MTANFIKSSKAFSVFIVSANNRIVPLETAIDHNDPVAERESYTAEKCLLYVALTRSQKQRPSLPLRTVKNPSLFDKGVGQQKLC